MIERKLMPKSIIKVSKKITMFSTEKFDGSDPGKAYDHWTDFDITDMLLTIMF